MMSRPMMKEVPEMDDSDPSDKPSYDETSQNQELQLGIPCVILIMIVTFTII